MNHKPAIYLVFVAVIIFAGCDVTLSQRKTESETPNDKFYRSGGKTTKAQTTYKDGEYSTANIADGRDLATFESGGHFVRPPYFLPDENQTKLKQEQELSIIRDFIWNMWSEKRKGYIRITLHSVDAATTSHIFIEPDKDGKSHIFWRLVRHNDEIDDVPNITRLEKRKPKPSDEQSGDFVLVFKGKDGTEWQTF